MFVPKNRGFKRQYVYGGAGMFDSIAGFITRLFTSNVASNVAKQITSSALNAGKFVAKEAGKKALNIGKTAAVDAGKKFIEKSVTKVFANKLTPKSKAILKKHAGVQMQQKANNLSNYMVRIHKTLIH